MPAKGTKKKSTPTDRIVRRFKQCPGCGAPFKRKKGRVRCAACAGRRLELQWKAIQAVRKALALGSLHKQPCEFCGAAKVDAHHDDYSKPLAVRWLCRAHHRQHHAAAAKTKPLPTQEAA